MTIDFAYKPGDVVRHTITGFEGVVTAVAYYATGCRHYGVQPQRLTNDGKQPEWEWIDGHYLELVKPEQDDQGRRPAGGPSPNPPAR